MFSGVQWRTWDHEKEVAGDLKAEELYDQRNDPQENQNIANLPKNSGLLKEMAAQMSEGWKSAKPQLKN